MKKIVAFKSMLLLFGVTGILLSSAAASALDVVEPYVRAVPPGQPNSAAFMILRNTEAVEKTVVKVATPVAEVAELHVHKHVDGMMQMRQVDEISIPASGETVLKPGGFHIMLIRLKQELIVGDEIPLTLTLKNAETIEVLAPVKSLMAPPMRASGHDMTMDDAGMGKHSQQHGAMH